jgi:hypothetical protein
MKKAKLIAFVGTVSSDVIICRAKDEEKVVRRTFGEKRSLSDYVRILVFKKEHLALFGCQGFTVGKKKVRKIDLSEDWVGTAKEGD